MKILPITQGHYDVFHSLLTDYYRDGEDAQTPQEELDAFIGLLFDLCQENRISGGIAYGQGPVGFVLWGMDGADFPFSNKPGYGTILEIGMIPSMRGTGLGKELAEYAENAMACRQYYVCAYGPAEHFWRKCGYQHLGETARNGLKLLVKTVGCYEKEGAQDALRIDYP